MIHALDILAVFSQLPPEKSDKSKMNNKILHNCGGDFPM